MFFKSSVVSVLSLIVVLLSHVICFIRTPKSHVPLFLHQKSCNRLSMNQETDQDHSRNLVYPTSDRSRAYSSASTWRNLIKTTVQFSFVSYITTRYNNKPALAASSLESANIKLSTYDLPPILFCPQGFSTIVSEYGRGNAKQPMNDPVIVQFSYPALWVSSTTSVNNNGEAGTISAGDYFKGDSAYFFTQPLNDAQLSSKNKDLIQKYILKSISQKGDMSQSLVIGNIKEQEQNGQNYIYVEFSYELNTEAGFLVRRKAIMSLTSVGKSIQSLTAVTTGKRYKDMAIALKDITNSFRVYPLKSGIFASQTSQ